jgi:hypothetical protein
VGKPLVPKPEETLGFPVLIFIVVEMAVPVLKQIQSALGVMQRLSRDPFR